jgi:hypothetical protein
MVYIIGYQIYKKERGIGHSPNKNNAIFAFKKTGSELASLLKCQLGWASEGRRGKPF